MKPEAHAAQAAAGAAALYPFIGFNALIFGAAVVAIDLDHFIEYWLDTKSVSIRGLFKYHDTLLNNLDNFLGLNVFHTLECYAVLYVAGLYLDEANLVLMGFLFHHLLDQLQLSYMGRPYARAFSVAEYLVRRRRGYFTSIREVVKARDT
ncbi:MAG: hypothetical protein HY884_05485 [Deltaproteobacteria bacterium]|nr:hypothetical protein [Deltaproteobacteria bacterium]